MALPRNDWLDEQYHRLGIGILPRPLRSPFPDWTKHEVLYERAIVTLVDKSGTEWILPSEKLESRLNYRFCFPALPPRTALLHGWFNNLDDYVTFAALVFAHRNTDHPIATSIRATLPPVTDEHIVSLQKGVVPEVPANDRSDFVTAPIAEFWHSLSIPGALRYSALI